jgi:radical SAM superfamily enzyme YgiQ (UPF0313 family)
MAGKLKIVFVGVNSSYSHTMLSYGYVRAYTERFINDCSWEYLETNINDDPTGVMLRIADAQPDIVLGTVYLFNQEFMFRILKPLKRLIPDCRIYLGGPQFAGDNRAVLTQNPEFTGVIRGDESSVWRLINDASAIVSGLCHIQNGEYVDGGTACHEGAADDIPSPYELGYYQRGKPFYQVETSRGCNGRCSFCTSALSTRVLNFSLSRIYNELDVLRRDGVKEIRIVDRTFNESTSRAVELLCLFRDDFPEMRFHLEINPAMLNREILEALGSFPVGSLHLEAGIQSFSDASLKAVTRPANAARSIQGLEQLLALGNVEVHADLIAGLPEQSYTDTLRDVEQLIGLAPHEIQLENLKILPGTPLENKPVRGHIWNPLPPYEILQTKGFSTDELQQTRYLSKLIDSYYNVPDLRGLFAYCVKNYPGFLERFMNYVKSQCDPLQKYSPKIRLEHMQGFAREHGDIRLEELVKFIWLKLGLSPEHYGIKVYKTVPGETEPGRKIWDSSSDQPAKRFFEADFSFNAAQICLMKDPFFIDGVHIYRFYLVHGQNTKAIHEK